MDGIDVLKMCLYKLEERYITLVMRGYIPEDEQIDIEQTKRFFILLLMGVVTADSEYDEYYRKSIFILGDRID